MKHRALEILHRMREYALEQEERKLMERQREEMAKEQECRASLAVLEESYSHSVVGAHVHDYARRDGCIREAGGRHTLDIRQLGLAQMARRDQVQVTLRAKTRADMIAKVLEKRHAEDRVVSEQKLRKETDDAMQSQFFHARAETLY